MLRREIKKNSLDKYKQLKGEIKRHSTSWVILPLTSEQRERAHSSSPNKDEELWQAICQEDVPHETSENVEEASRRFRQ